MEKFILIQKDFALDTLKVKPIFATDINIAWEIVEDNYDNTNVQNWLLTQFQAINLFTKLQELLTKGSYAKSKQSHSLRKNMASRCNYS